VIMSTLSSKGQALVRAGQRAYQPTDTDRERLLGALRSQLGEAALPLEMSQLATAAASGHTVWWLISAVVVGIGVVGGAVYLAGRAETKASHPQATNVAPAAATVEPVAVPPAEEPAPTAATMPMLDAPSLPATTGYHAKDRLAAEVAILSRATRDLRAGQPAEALKALDEYRRKFPKGLLGEEHRAARAQALCALGRFDEANARLAELQPQSPLAVRAKQFCKASLAAR
jgi:hypothetical protein